MDYDTTWMTMTLSGGYYQATWETPYENNDFYITIRATTDENTIGFDWKETNVNT